MGISMPQCNREEDDFSCKDCGRDLTHDPDMFVGRVEFCLECMASWTAELRDIEKVYLIVPGVRRAQAGDEVEVYRFGESSTILAVSDAMPEKPSFHRQIGPTALPAYNARPAITLDGRSRQCFISSA